MTINEILQGDANINNLSKDEYIRIIKEISYRYKALLYEFQSVRNVSNLEREENVKIIKKLENDIKNLNSINRNLMNVFDRDLSISERLTGKINIKKSIQKR